MATYPNRLAVSEYILPPPRVLITRALDANERSRSAQLDRLALLSDSIAKGRAALKQLSERLDCLVGEAEHPEVQPEELEGAASALVEAELAAAASLAPQLKQLERNLARKQPPTDFARSLRRVAEEALDIGQTWLELYQNVRIRLLKLASDRRSAAGEAGSPIFSEASEMEQYLRRLEHE